MDIFKEDSLLDPIVSDAMVEILKQPKVCFVLDACSLEI